LPLGQEKLDQQSLSIDYGAWGYKKTEGNGKRKEAAQIDPDFDKI